MNRRRETSHSMVAILQSLPHASLSSSDNLRRNSSSLISESANPTMAKCSDSSPCDARLYSEGSRSRFDRSPVMPKITMAHGRAACETHTGIDSVRCELMRRGLDIAALPIDRHIGAQLADQRHTILARCGAQHARAAEFGELHGERSHAARSSMNDDRLVASQF